MNELFFGIISGVDTVIGFAMIVMLGMGVMSRWNRVGKLGFFIIALGLLGQAYYFVNGLTLSDPFFDQIWALKDIGIAIFVVGFVNAWIDSLKRKLP